ncbi:hypothetical protein CA600_06440 [Paenibacillus sp. VTT E-133280]|uniref:hypothetical protein n=1 Tax=Paenibacillus sp. VTT E-133280 TaxID=1986222 RepID=UPI000BA14BCD|nr:hypothetical protein [Paenibacillus sp. VTT E-133280]OZQ68446.1 hypothetical protein CA600_06440 [Paenibacillus sp. VTT E-133280]
MPSENYSFQAGNIGDVIKHTVLLDILEILTKDKNNFFYLETHGSTYIHKLKPFYKYRTGVGKLWKNNIIDKSHIYFDFQSENGSNNYY